MKLTLNLERPTGRRLYYLVFAISFMGWGFGAVPKVIFTNDTAMMIYLCGIAAGFGAAAAIAFLIGHHGSPDYDDAAATK